VRDELLHANALFLDKREIPQEGLFYYTCRLNTAGFSPQMKVDHLFLFSGAPASWISSRIPKF
jgi:hypothetical protein